jgi:hypothetical protein
MSGPGQGEALPIADGYFTEWYEWVEGHPQTKFAQKTKKSTPAKSSIEQKAGTTRAVNR